MVATAPSLKELSAPRARLVRLMQNVNFGRLEQLALVSGDPVFDPAPKVIREIKFGGENGPRPERSASEFLLKQQVVELLEFFDDAQNIVIEALEVKHGLPFRCIYSVPTR